jgi:regulator of sigma E protease
MPIILVAVVIGSLVIVHEFGHLIVAKLSGQPVETFSVGFGPVLIKKQIGSTVYQLALIPLGGFIKLTGEDYTAESGFNAAPLGNKIGVIIAGPISNLILGIILTAILYAVFGVSNPIARIMPEPSAQSAGFSNGDYILKINQDTIKNWNDLANKMQVYNNQDAIFSVKQGDAVKTILFHINIDSFPFLPFIEPVIDRVREGSPAHTIGLKSGDIILEVDNKPIPEWYSFTEIVQGSGQKKLFIKWQHNNKVLEDTIIPQSVADELSNKRIGAIGVWVRLPEKPMPVFKSIGIATTRSLYVCEQTFVILYKIIAGKLPRSAIGGPVMVAKYTYEGAQWGAKYLLGLWALLSINLCVINLIPIPIVDGGRILLYIIESVRRKKLTKKEWEISFWIGYALIGLLLIFALTNDITRLIKK